MEMRGGKVRGKLVGKVGLFKGREVGEVGKMR